MHIKLRLSRKLIKLALSLAFLGLAALFLAACKGDSASPTPEDEVIITDVDVTNPQGRPTLEPYVFKTSEPDTITIHGRLIVLDPMSILPNPDDALYLVPMDPAAGITTIPQFEVGTVPQAEVDERTGEFVFTNIQPGTWAVVVMTKGGAQFPARNYQTKDYVILTIEESQRDSLIELGDLSLP